MKYLKKRKKRVNSNFNVLVDGSTNFYRISCFLYYIWIVILEKLNTVEREFAKLTSTSIYVSIELVHISFIYKI